MSFQFDSVSAFWQMAGHGPYVWSCYAIAAVMLVFLVVNPILKHRQFLHRQSQQQNALHSYQQNQQKNVDVKQPSILNGQG